MPLIAQVPKNSLFIKKYGSYRRALNVLDRKETAVQREISRSGMGYYEPRFQAALLALCEENLDRLVFYDVGAHIGIYSALIGTIFRKTGCAVVAFEPTPRTFEICCQMRDVNDLTYSVVRSAIGADSGTVDFFLSPKAETSNSMNASFRPGATHITVPLTTIDRVVNSGFPAPSVMKIDVETLEPEVLTGARKTIAKHRPFITCEFLPHGSSDTIGELLSWMAFYKYQFYHVTDDRRFPTRSVKDVLCDINGDTRDWILAPATLSENYFELNRNWLSALKTADKNSNKFVEGGTLIKGDLTPVW